VQLDGSSTSATTWSVSTSPKALVFPLVVTDLFRGPRFHRDVHFHKHTDRAVGWLELFYDLVYVATLIQIGNFLSSNLTWSGFGQFWVLLFLVWWAWTGETLYQNRYFVDDVTHRLLVLVQMIGVAAMGLSVSGAFGELSAQFALAYALVRSMMLTMFARVRRSHPESADVSLGFMVGFALGIAVFLGSLLLPEGSRWIMWLIAIAAEIVYFARPKTLRATFEWAPDDHHLVERFGIFTIIVLGEAFVKILDDAQGTSLGLDQLLMGALIVVLLFALWWLHFSDAADEVYNPDSTVSVLAWSYGHLFLAGSLVMFGVASKKVFSHSIDAAAKALKDETRLLLTTALVVFFLAQALINAGLDHDATPHNHRRRIALYLGAAIATTLIGSAVTGLASTVFTGVLTIISLGLVVASIAESKQHAPQVERAETPGSASI